LTIATIAHGHSPHAMECNVRATGPPVSRQTPGPGKGLTAEKSSSEFNVYGSRMWATCRPRRTPRSAASSLRPFFERSEPRWAPHGCRLRGVKAHGQSLACGARDAPRRPARIHAESLARLCQRRQEM
jgi:hypothetical protein